MINLKQVTLVGINGKSDENIAHLLCKIAKHSTKQINFNNLKDFKKNE
jgi:hypothetical protein